MGNREKASDAGEHNVAKVATAIGVTGLVAAAGVAAAVVKRKRRPKEVHASQRERVRDLQTYDLDEEGRTPEEIAAIFKDPRLKAEGELLPEVAVLIHFASTGMVGGTTFARLRQQIDETVEDEAIQAAIAHLEAHGLIAPPPEHNVADGQQVKYTSTRTLAWAIDQTTEDFQVLAHATNKVIMNGLGAADEF